MVLSVVIPVKDDWDRLQRTLDSIQETLPFSSAIRVIIIDDASDSLARLDGSRWSFSVEHIRLPACTGTMMSRDLGLRRCDGWVLTCDSHMLFHQGWYDCVSRQALNPETLYTTTYITFPGDQIDYDMSCAVNICGGATVRWLGWNGKAYELFYLDPMPELGESEYERFAPIGACYVLYAETYRRLGGMIGLRSWGAEEAFLAMNWWLSGGQVRVLRDLRVGHRMTNSSSGFEPVIQAYNRLILAFLFLGDDYFNLFLSMLSPKAVDQVLAELKPISRLLHGWREGLRARQKRDIDWLCAKFDLYHPDSLFHRGLKFV
jgi:hypothetical protein